MLVPSRATRTEHAGVVGVLAELAHRGVGIGHVGDVADHARQEADRRDLGDPWHALAHAVELVAQHALHRGGVADKALGLGDVEGGQRRRAGDRVAGIGVQMKERLSRKTSLTLPETATAPIGM